MSSFFSLTLTLFFVIDALGNLPTYLKIIQRHEKKKQIYITCRELLAALLIMLLFQYLGKFVLDILGIQTATVQIAGGITLFLISIHLIFTKEEEGIVWSSQGSSCIVPLATPLIAGPSVLAVIMIFSQEESAKWLLVGAIFTSWLLSSLIFFAAKPLYRLCRDQALDACQRLMGLIVALIAVQHFLEGLQRLLSS